MAENLSVGTSVEVTDIYGMMLRDLETPVWFNIAKNYKLGQKLAGYVTKTPAENNNQ